MSAVVFAAACGGGQPPRTNDPPHPPADLPPLAGVPIKPWPKQLTSEPAWRAGGKPAYAIITVGGSDAAAIVWVTSNGKDLTAVYCVDQAQLDRMRAQILEHRGTLHDGFMELQVQPDKHTDVCAAPTRPHAATPPTPPTPSPPTTASAPRPTAAHCPSAAAICNFVIGNPQQKGPGGEPIPDIVWKFDIEQWNRHVFTNQSALPTAPTNTTTAPR